MAMKQEFEKFNVSNWNIWLDKFDYNNYESYFNQRFYTINIENPQEIVCGLMCRDVQIK